ncbi:MAG TPA: ABC transporter permease, partial [Candidatus Polarisedimenticolia bacterium]|nr:ABC transporter permease [Candidatus Polarisedimenticolia bacterium]
MISQLVQDVRYAVRTLGRAPGFTVVSVLILALGIGATTALFSVVNAVLLTPLPYPESDRLAMAERTETGNLRTIASFPEFMDWHDSGVFAQSAAVVGKGFFLDTDEGPAPLVGRRVTEEFFGLLRVRPQLGRDFLPDEARTRDDVAVIGHAFWANRLGGDPEVVGRDLRLRDRVVHVVGVLPEEFVDPIDPARPRDLYIPLIASAEERGPGGRNSQWVQVLGRLRDGITLEQAASQIRAISERAQRERAGSDPRSLAPFTLRALIDHHVAAARPALWMVFGAVGCVLLIGCVNVSNLMGARLAARGHELAVRAAVGASGRRLAAQLMTESLVLSSAGAVVALVLILWTIDLIREVSPADLPRIGQAGLDLRVFGFALFVSVVSGLLLGLLPVLRGSRQDLLAVLKQTRGAGGTSMPRSRGWLLAGEVALTCVLMVGAMLSLTSLRRLLAVDPGFRTDHVLSVDLSYAGDWKPEAVRSFFAALVTRAGEFPGVVAAGSVDNLPYSGSWSQFSTTVQGFAEGFLPELQGKTIEYQQAAVGGDYFRVMGIPLEAGRVFDRRDDAPGAPGAVVISASLARALWGDQDPLGRRLGGENGSFGRGGRPSALVVGIVGSVRQFGPDSPVERTLYRPMNQGEPWGGTLLVRTEGDPATLVPLIRQAARDIDAAVIFRRALTMKELLSARTAAPRFLAVLLGCFGAAALLLAALGVYGVLAYSVSQRTREIGVRVALGASQGSVLGMVVRQGMAPAVAGIAFGLAGAAALSGLLRGLLYG